MSDFPIDAIILYSPQTLDTYNCFTSLLAADDYHGRRLNNKLWRDADEDTRTSALYHATDILDRQRWIGLPTDTAYEQPLSWPRRLVPNRISMANYNLTMASGNGIDYGGNTGSLGGFKYLDSDSIPRFMQDATAELGLYLIEREATGKNQVSQYDDQLSSLSLGGIDMSFRQENVYVPDIPHQVHHIISDFLAEIKEFDPSLNAAFGVTLKRG